MKITQYCTLSDIFPYLTSEKESIRSYLHYTRVRKKQECSSFSILLPPLGEESGIQFCIVLILFMKFIFNILFFKLEHMNYSVFESLQLLCLKEVSNLHLNKVFFSTKVILTRELKKPSDVLLPCVRLDTCNCASLKTKHC